MKCLLVYGTLSGSTMTAAELIATTLRSAGLTIDVVPVENASKQTVSAYDAVIIGSPSWEDQGKDGQPLPEITTFLSSLSKEDLANKKICIFGLGDVSYPHFCGAVDVMEAKLKSLDIVPSIESLRVDRYYSIPDNEEKVKAWADNVSKLLHP